MTKNLKKHLQTLHIPFMMFEYIIVSLKFEIVHIQTYSNRWN